MAEAWLLSLGIVLGLRAVRFGTLLAVLDRARARRSSVAAATVTSERTAALVASAGARVPAATCLTNALVLRHILQRRDVNSELVISTRQSDGGFEAHALARLDGRILLGGGHDDYTPLWSDRLASPNGGSSRHHAGSPDEPLEHQLTLGPGTTQVLRHAGMTYRVGIGG